MAKCTRCGRKGFFLEALRNGLVVITAYRLCGWSRSRPTLKAQMEEISAKLSDQKALFERISADAYADGVAKAKAKNAELTTQNLQIEERILAGKKNLVELSEKEEKSRKSAANAEQKVRRCKELIKAIQHANEAFGTDDQEVGDLEKLLNEADGLMSPTVTLTLQCLDMKDLRKRYKENEKNIQATFEKYKDRYTTKANITIYRLMVIALSDRAYRNVTEQCWLWQAWNDDAELILRPLPTSTTSSRQMAIRALPRQLRNLSVNWTTISKRP